jgi:membrane-bound serine protease (ClpP class)
MRSFLDSYFTVPRNGMSYYNWAERVVRLLSNPAFAPMLLSIGMLGIFVEFKTPTFGIAGAIGILSFSAFFGSHLLIGLAGLEEFILLGVGVIALALEVLVIPGFGVAGVVAVLCITGAIFLSLIGSIPTWDDFARASSVVTGAMLLAGIGMAALIKMLPNTNRMQAVFLGASEDREAGYIAAPERKELIGHFGVAVTDLRPSGTATIGDERVDVVTQGEFITKGTEVRVIESEAYRHIVEAADDVA